MQVSFCHNVSRWMKLGATRCGAGGRLRCDKVAGPHADPAVSAIWRIPQGLPGHLHPRPRAGVLPAVHVQPAALPIRAGAYTSFPAAVSGAFSVHATPQPRCSEVEAGCALFMLRPLNSFWRDSALLKAPCRAQFAKCKSESRSATPMCTYYHASLTKCSSGSEWHCQLCTAVLTVFFSCWKLVELERWLTSAGHCLLHRQGVAGAPDFRCSAAARTKRRTAGCTSTGKLQQTRS